jgi:hypothetical protein
MIKTMSSPFTLKLLSEKLFTDIPSASGIAYVDGVYYIAGDDAAKVFCLDTSWHILNTITLTDFSGYRMPKSDKMDWESLTLMNIEGIQHLMVLGSGSKSPQRDIAAIINISMQPPLVEMKPLGRFYDQLRGMGITSLNIEGCTSVGAGVLLANRGHLTDPNNTLLYCDPLKIWEPGTVVRSVHLDLPQVPGTFNGVSGLCYDAINDRLLFTTSAEATSNAYDDGAIGESMVGVITAISARLQEEVIRPDYLVHLSSVSPVFRQQKIEGICMVPDVDGLQLVLAADNDDGTSHLFKLLAKG